MKYFHIRVGYKKGVPRPKKRILHPPAGCTDKWPLDAGAPVHDWNDRVALTLLEPGIQQDFDSLSGTWHVMSERMREILGSQCMEDVQFLPLRIRSLIGEYLPESLFVANYLQLLKAVDKRRSTVADGDWTIDEFGEFAYLQVPVLNRPKIGAAKAFRVNGAKELVIYREDVVTAVEQAGMMGCIFSEIAVVD